MITATPNPTTGSVLLDATGLADDTSILRDEGAGGVFTVRNGANLGPGDHLVTDWECPLGVPVVYRTTDGSESAPVTLAPPAGSDGAWVTHPTRPGLSQTVRVERDTPVTWASPGQVHVPVDGGPVTVTHTSRRLITGDLVFLLESNRVQAFATLFTDGSPLLLRTPPSCEVSSRWFWAADVTRDREPRAAWARLTARYTVVAAPDPVVVAPEPDWTWDAVTTTHTTWNQVVATYPSWFALLGGPPGGGAVVF